jgi:hypothetical protein
VFFEHEWVATRPFFKFQFSGFQILAKNSKILAISKFIILEIPKLSPNVFESTMKKFLKRRKQTKIKGPFPQLQS